MPIRACADHAALQWDFRWAMWVIASSLGRKEGQKSAGRGPAGLPHHSNHKKSSVSVKLRTE